MASNAAESYARLLKARKITGSFLDFLNKHDKQTGADAALLVFGDEDSPERAHARSLVEQHAEVRSASDETWMIVFGLVECFLLGENTGTRKGIHTALTDRGAAVEWLLTDALRAVLDS